MLNKHGIISLYRTQESKKNERKRFSWKIMDHEYELTQFYSNEKLLFLQGQKIFKKMVKSCRIKTKVSHGKTVIGQNILFLIILNNFVCDIQIL